MITELDEQSKEALIAYLKDDKTELEYRYRHREDTWTHWPGTDRFDLGLFSYRIAKPKRKYRVWIAGGGAYVVDNEQQAIRVENFPSFKRWLTDWVEYDG